MADISPVGSGGPGGNPHAIHHAALNGHVNGVANVGGAANVGSGFPPVGRLDVPLSPTGQRLEDTVEVSDRALFLQSIMGIPPMRQEVIAAARELIQREDYPSDEQMQIALERMIAEWE